MRMANQTSPLLMSDLIFSKEPKRLEQSVFYSDSSISQEQQQYQTRISQDSFYYRIGTDQDAQKQAPKRPQELPQIYNTFVSKHESSDITTFTLGQCLCTIFEKAIYVQYQDYLSKIERYQLYFFLGDKTIVNNVFTNDQLLIRFWARMSQEDRERVFKHLDVIEKEMRAEEHNPIKMLVCSRINESNFEDDEEEGATSKMKRNIIKSSVAGRDETTKDRLNKIFKSEEEEDFEDDSETEGIQGGSLYAKSQLERSRGIASSSMRIKVGQSIEYDEDLEGDPIVGQQDQSDDEDYDLENQRKFQRNSNLGVGAVGKLQHLKKSHAQKSSGQASIPKSGFYNKRNEALQDDEEDEYSQDNFEIDSEGNNNDSNEIQGGGGSYFMDNEQQPSRQSRQASDKQFTRQMKEQMLDGLENPLLTHNKFYFVRQQLKKFMQQGRPGYSPIETIEVMTVRFVKSLSIFIGLETVLVASTLLTGGGGLPSAVNLSQFEESSSSTSPATISVLAIPIKQRLYSHLLELEDKTRWDDLLSGDTSQTKKEDSQQTIAINAKPSLQAKSIVPPTSQPKISIPLPLASNDKESASLPKKSKPEVIPLFSKGGKGVVDVVAQVSSVNSQSNKNKKKKKKEKEKAKKAAAAAALALGATQHTSPEQDIEMEKTAQRKALEKQIRGEQYSIEIVKEMMSRNPGGDSVDFNFAMQKKSSQLLLLRDDDHRFKEERRSLISGKILSDKYPELNDYDDPREIHYCDHVLNDPTIGRGDHYRLSEDVEMQDVSEEASKKAKNAKEEEEEVGGCSSSTNNDQQKKKKRKKNKKNKKKGGGAGNDLEGGAGVGTAVELSEIELKEQEVTSEIEEEVDQTVVITTDVQSVIDHIYYELPQDVKDELESLRKFGQEIAEEIEQYETTQKLAKEMATSLIQKTLDTIRLEEEDEKVKLASLKKEDLAKGQPLESAIQAKVVEKNQTKRGGQGKKNKKNLVTPPLAASSVLPVAAPIVQPKLSKKQAKQAAKKALLQERKAAEEAKQLLQLQAESREIEDVDEKEDQEDEIPEEIVSCESDHQSDEKPGERQQYELSNVNLQLFDKQQDNEDTHINRSDHTPEKRSNQSKKVGFRMAATTPRQPFFNSLNEGVARGYHSSSAEDIGNNVKIPKRGSSRGSSCTADAIHQSTISMLGDLFPQEYKNPSDDTKLRISKITTSSSNSNNGNNPGSFQNSPDQQPPSVSSRPKTATTGLQPQIVSKFLEESFLEGNGQPSSKQGSKKRGPGNRKSTTESETVRNQNQHRGKGVKNSGKVVIGEFDSYEAMFQVAYSAANKKDVAQQDNTKAPVQEGQASVLSEPSSALESTLVESLIPNQNKEEVKISEVAAPLPSQNKGAKKRSGKQQNTGDHSLATVKEMKERGAIARPSDIELASANQKKQQQQTKKEKPKAATTNHSESLIPPTVVHNIQRTQTPVIGGQTDNLLAGSGHHNQQQPHNHHKNTAQSKPNHKQGGVAALNKQGNQKNTTSQPPKQRKNNAGPNHKQGANPQQIPSAYDPLQQSMLGDQASQMSAFLAGQPFLPNTFNLFGNSGLGGLQNQNGYIMPTPQAQQLFPLGLPQFPPLPYPPTNHLMGMNLHGSVQTPLPTQQQQQQLQHNQNLGGGYFTNQDFSNYHSTSFQTPHSESISDLYDSQQIANMLLLSEREKSICQHTQTDETRIRDIQSQQAQQQQQQQTPVVMNQYQNINVQVQMQPPQTQGFQPQGFNSQNPYMFQQQQQQQQNPFSGSMMDQLNYQSPSFNPHQNMMYQPLQFNPMSYGGGTGGNLLAPPFQGSGLNSFTFPPSTGNHMLDLQNQFIQQQSILNSQFNMLGLAPPNQQQFQQPFNPQATHHFNQSSSMPLLGQQQQQQQYQSNQHQQLNRGGGNSRMHHSMSFGQPSLNNTIPSQQDLVQNLFNLLTMQNAPPRHRQSMSSDHDGLHDMGGGEKNISHMSQDQYQRQYNMQDKEEQFYYKLDQEIFKLQSKLKERLSNIDAERQSVLRMIEQLVKETYSESSSAKVEVYGSMATGLAIDSSDMDLLVSGVFQMDQTQMNRAMMGYSSSPMLVDRVTLIEQMKRLFRELTNSESRSQGGLKECLENVQIIDTASVPVIKLIIDLKKIREMGNPYGSSKQQHNEIEEEMRLLKIDITYNDQYTNSQEDLQFPLSQALLGGQMLHMGLKCCHFIKSKLDQLPVLECLTLVLKKFLATRNLNSPFLGGLNSYGLIILIVSFLNQDWSDLYTREGMISSGKALKCFLYYFGRLFDPNSTMINEQQQIVAHMNFSSILMIQDPLNPHNNIGKSTFNFDTIRSEFSQAYESLHLSMLDFVQGQIDDVTVVAAAALPTQPEIHSPEDSASKQSFQQASSQKVVWKKKLDILSKILSPFQLHEKQPQINLETTA